MLYNFTDGTDGGAPFAGLVFDQNGNIYGTTVEGGNLNCNSPSGCGVVFQLRPNANRSWTESVLHSFNGKDGHFPLGGLIFDAAGSLYGASEEGGDVMFCGYGCGVVFKLAPNANGAWKETVLHRLIDRPGAFPAAGLIFDATGNLFGTDTGDGRANFGSVFEIRP